MNTLILKLAFFRLLSLDAINVLLHELNACIIDIVQNSYFLLRISSYFQVAELTLNFCHVSVSVRSNQSEDKKVSTEKQHDNIISFLQY